MKAISRRCISAVSAALAMLAVPGAATAQPAAHVHGQVQLDVVVDGALLTVRLEAPLDSLVGFEHRPRTAAQKKAATDALARIDDVAAWLRPPAAAGCELVARSVEADALRPAPAGAGAQAAHSGHAEHADLVAEVSLRCATPAELTALNLSLFQAFARIRQVDVRVAGPAGQLRQTLRPPATAVPLTR